MVIDGHGAPVPIMLGLGGLHTAIERFRIIEPQPRAAQPAGGQFYGLPYRMDIR
jgi:hypothetical protein